VEDEDPETETTEGTGFAKGLSRQSSLPSRRCECLAMDETNGSHQPRRIQIVGSCGRLDGTTSPPAQKDPGRCHFRVHVASTDLCSYRIALFVVDAHV
jgi:hypothetical protein